MLSYAVFLLGTYLLDFVLLVFMYTKILLHVRSARKSHSKLMVVASSLFLSSSYLCSTFTIPLGSRHPSSPSYGAVATMLMKGHSQAKKRVVYFLSVFIITGIASWVRQQTSSMPSLSSATPYRCVSLTDVCNFWGERAPWRCKNHPLTWEWHSQGPSWALV